MREERYIKIEREKYPVYFVFSHRNRVSSDRERLI